MKILIWGYGVIGSRHAKNFSEAGASVQVLSRRNITDYTAFTDLNQALQSETPDWIFITSETSEHYPQLKKLADSGYQNHVLVEKPLFDKNFEVPKNSFKSLSVSYNLRLHPLVQKLKVELTNEKIISAVAYVGQYLPDWRKTGQDYRQFYSAQKEKGGGALRDLSHELDLALYLLGPFKNVYGDGGHFSNLEIDSDDVFSLISETQNCRQVLIHMNYLDRKPERFFRVQTEKSTYILDLLKNTLQIDNEPMLTESTVLETYLGLAQCLLSDRQQVLTSASEAQHLMKVIAAAEESCRVGKKIQL